MTENHPKKLIAALATAMEEAEQIAGSSGADKRLYALGALRSLAVNTLSFDDALLVGLAPHIVEIIVAATKGLVDINIDEKGGEPSPRCCVLS